MKRHLLLSAALFLLTLFPTFAQEDISQLIRIQEPDSSRRAELLRQWFSGYNLNYFAVDTHGDVLFQISVKYKLVDLTTRDLPWSVHLGFTQKSFWAYTTKESGPFEELNFQPELWFQAGDVLGAPDQQLTGETRFGLKHHSNGRAGDVSRSWDRAYIGGRLLWRDSHLGSGEPFNLAQSSINLTLWTTLRDSQNPTITRYYGPGELALSSKIGPIFTAVTLPFSVEKKARVIPSVTGNLAFQVPVFMDLQRVYLYVRGHIGYGSSIYWMSDYEKSIHFGLIMHM